MGWKKNSKNFVKFVGMESFLTAVSDLIPALQKHRAKFRIGSTNRSKIHLIHTILLIPYDSQYESYDMNSL